MFGKGIYLADMSSKVWCFLFYDYPIRFRTVMLFCSNEYNMLL